MSAHMYVGGEGGVEPSQGSTYITDFTRVVKTVGYASARDSKKEENKLIWSSVDISRQQRSLRKPSQSCALLFRRVLSHTLSQAHRPNRLI